MRRRIILGVALLALGGAPAGAQTSETERAARFERRVLSNACGPMAVTIRTPEHPRLAAPVQDAAESRLRAARVYADALTDPQPSALVVAIELVPEYGVGRYQVSVKYEKPVMDPVTGLTRIGAASSRMRLGVEDRVNDDPEILNTVSELLDQFLAAYLRVNAEACA